MKRASLLLLGLFVLLVMGANAAQPLILYPVVPASEVQPPNDCRRYYGDICKNWRIGEWLPVLIDGFEPWRRGKTSTVHFVDAFVYRGQLPKEKDWAQSQGYRADGTRFVYGNAGPPKGNVVYDYIHAIAFYSQGCCSWHSTVLADGVTVPPMPVVNRLLLNMRTLQGIALGDTAARVESVYGRATSQPIPEHPQMRLLSYMHPLGRSCGQFQNFGFLRGRLMHIELLNGC